MSRINNKFKKIKDRQLNIAYFNAGDPDLDTSFDIIKDLPNSGVDIIEIGMPFLDPAGDGPIIELSSKRAVKAGISLVKIFKLINNFRENDNETPIVLMGYFNPIFKYGIEAFIRDAKSCGVDALLIVDLPTEEEQEILPYCKKYNIDIIKLITPNLSEDRIEKNVKNAGGFLYLVSVLGITGTKESNIEQCEKQIEKIKKFSNLPIAVGFGVRDRKQISKLRAIGADAVVVGSKFVEVIEKNLNNSKDKIIKEVTSEVKKIFGEI
jgi:tryptophan synthase alpha chain